jgi:hypothetical protein
MPQDHPMTDPDVAEVAGRLSAAQRKAILSAKASGNPERWICCDANRVRGPLLAKGLIYLAVPMFSWRSERRDVALTDFGIRVRQYLNTPSGER